MKPSRALANFLPPLFFLGWALAFTYPLIHHLSDSVILVRGGDAWLHLWDLWWLDKSLVDLHQNPYFTNYLLYPTGLNLFYHSLDVVNGLLSIPLQHLFGLTTSFNILVVANITMVGLAAYWLCLEKTRSWQAGIIGGSLFAAMPLLGSSLDLGQLDEITVWWVPLFMLALWRALDSPGPVWSSGGGRRAVLAAGVCLAGASLATWYFTAGLVIFTIIFVPAYLLARHKDESEPAAASVWLAAASKLAAVFGLFALILSPLLWAMIRERLSGATYMLSTSSATIHNSADLEAIFLPPHLVTDLNQHGSTVAFGYVALILAGMALFTNWRKLWPVGLALMALVVMALGPELQVFGIETGIPLPYALLNNVPFIGASRQPLRFLATADASLCLLAACGAGRVLEAIKNLNWRNAATAAAAGLIAIELFGVPRILVVTGAGPAYVFLKSNPTQGAVLEVPAETWSALSLLDQTHHERPIVGGYTSRHFPYPFADAAPGVAQLFHEDPDPLLLDDILSPSVASTALASLDYYDVRFVVVHKSDLATGRHGRLEDILSTLYKDTDKVYEDGEVIVYRTPNSANLQTGGQLGNRLPIVGLGSGWHKIEGSPLHRWTGANVTNADAFVWIGIPAGAEGSYTLKLTGYAYKTPHNLSIVLDNRTLLQKELGVAPENIDVDLGTLPQGDHALLLKVKELPENPPNDDRKVGIGVTRIALEKLSTTP